jgi:hypothetical protein
MSDECVQAAIEQMEAWLADPTWEPDPVVLAQWHAAFLEAVGQAEKSIHWSALVVRAHRAGEQLEARCRELSKERDRVKALLEAQERGGRALKGYGASSR